ncbi:unnamed protein product [Protopolystoma xenopodis]|uniref:Uncharacterized protein n=1 Tax=Protopolystoma xenopodis TaxID=117903 RepID=A0A3S5FEL4_9PLAT|nr:unnamed protein product [Protopolystoma xenopodis]
MIPTNPGCGFFRHGVATITHPTNSCLATILPTEIVSPYSLFEIYRLCENVAETARWIVTKRIKCASCPKRRDSSLGWNSGKTTQLSSFMWLRCVETLQPVDTRRDLSHTPEDTTSSSGRSDQPTCVCRRLFVLNTTQLSHLKYDIF